MGEMKLGVARRHLKRLADEVEHREGRNRRGHGTGDALRQLSAYSSNQLVLMGRRYHWVFDLADPELERMRKDDIHRDSDDLAAFERLVDYHSGYREVALGADKPCACERNDFGELPRAEFDVWTEKLWCTICDHFLEEDDEERLDPDDVTFFRHKRYNLEERMEMEAPSASERSKRKKGLLKRLIGL